MMNALKKLSLVLSFLVFCQCTSKPKVVENAPPPNPFADLEKKIAAIQADSEMPGLQIQVIERSQPKFSYTHGVRALGFPEEIKDKDKFHYGSVGKTVTAVLIGQLIDLKVLTWETSLRDLVPKDMVLHPGHLNTTIAMLLSHQSGMGDAVKLQNKKLWPQLFKMKSHEGREKLVKALLLNPPQFKPGSKTQYSNEGFVVLGWILQKKTNFKFEELVKNKIFLPLIMDSCGFGPSDVATSQTPQQPWGHMLNKDGKLEAVKPGPMADNPPALAPAGTIHCSTEDWGKFLEMISQGFYHESTFLQEATFGKLLSLSTTAKKSEEKSTEETAESPEPPPENGQPPFTYGGFLRMDRSWAAGTALAMAGSNTMNYAFVAVAPSRDLVIIVVTNSGSKKAIDGTTQILQLLTEMK